MTKRTLSEIAHGAQGFRLDNNVASHTFLLYAYKPAEMSDFDLK